MENKYIMKKICHGCGYWTKNPKDGEYKCYCGDCPAKLRDNKKTNVDSMKIFEINNVDDYGRKTHCLGIFKANSADEARKIAAKYFNNKEIYTTGFYEARQITFKSLRDKEETYMALIKKETRIINK